MSRFTQMASLWLVVGLTACPSEKQSTGPSTETPSTETPSTETPSTETPSTETPSTETPSQTTPPDAPDLDALLAALASTAATPPPIPNADPQLYEGESVPNLSDPTTGTDASNGGIFTTKLGTTPLTFNEKWVSFDENALLLQPVSGVSKILKLQPVASGPTAGTLSAARISTYCAMTGSASFKLSDQNVAYFLFPTPAAIAALPTSNPPNTGTPNTYEVYTSNLGQPLVRSGTMYLEIQTPPTGSPVWKPFWVFESDYVFPGPGVETQVKLVPTGGFQTLKAFLEAMQTLRNAETPANQAKWRYSPITFSWTALCPPTP